MSEDTGRQEGLGKTGGLPGQHADPRALLLPEDERDDTVAMGDVGAAEQAEGLSQDRRSR
jgi:hypothetical protein